MEEGWAFWWGWEVKGNLVSSRTTKFYYSRYTVKRNLGDHRLDLLSFSPPTDSGQEPWESVWHAQEYRFTGVSSETVARRI